jgi:putative transposase
MTEERRLLSAPAWQELAPMRARGQHKAGRPPPQSARMFLEAVLYVARPGMPWRALPAEFGHWEAVAHRCRRGEQRRVWQQWWHH